MLSLTATHKASGFPPRVCSPRPRRRLSQEHSQSRQLPNSTNDLSKGGLGSPNRPPSTLPRRGFVGASSNRVLLDPGPRSIGQINNLIYLGLPVRMQRHHLCIHTKLLNINSSETLFMFSSTYKTKLLCRYLTLHDPNLTHYRNMVCGKASENRQVHI